MTFSKQIELFKRFNEGCELEDAVGLLLQGASILNGISCDHELSLVMLAVEKLIRDYCELGRNRELDWYSYNEIDPKLYSYILGGARKLTEEEYLTREISNYSTHTR